MSPAVGQVGDGARLRHGGHVERAAFGLDLELLGEVAGGDDLDVVVRISGDQLVEDHLVGVGLLGLTGAEQLDGAGVLTAAAAGGGGSTGVVSVAIVTAPRRDEREGTEWYQQSSDSHLVSPCCGFMS